MGETVIVTGVAGFVGVNLSLHLLDKGYRVVGFDIGDRHQRLKGTGLQHRRNFWFKKIDLTRPLTSTDELQDVAAVFHLAALPHVDYSYFHPRQAIENNTSCLLTAVELAQVLGAPLIFSSSVEVYGGRADILYSENEFLSPLSPYAASKVSAEAILATYKETHGLAATIFRFTNLFGPWQAPDRLLPRIMCQSLLGLDAAVERGTNRDFVYVGDACQVLEQAIGFAHACEIFNLSSGKRVDNAEAAHLVTRQLPNVSLSIINRRHHDGRGRYLVSNPEKLRRTTGWQPTTELSAGIAKTAQWYADHLEWACQFETQLKADRATDQFLTDAADWA